VIGVLQSWIAGHLTRFCSPGTEAAKYSGFAALAETGDFELVLAK
jgi:hypothetical protein